MPRPQINRPAWNILYHVMLVSITEWNLSRWDVLERVGAALERASEQGEECAQLDVGSATKIFARPHQKKRANSTSGAEDAIRSRNGRGGDRVISGLTLRRKIEVCVPAWLSDGAADDGRGVPVCLY